MSQMKLKKLRRLGKGETGFGIVYRAKVLNADELGLELDEIAVKRCFSTRDDEDEPNDFLEFITEVDMLKQFKHPYICSLYDVYLESPFIEDLSPIRRSDGEKYDTVGYLAMILARGSLHDLYTEKDGNYRIRKYLLKHFTIILYKLFIAIQYMHAKGVAHFDLKPDNVLITWKNEVDPKTGEMRKDSSGKYHVPMTPDVLLADLGFTRVPDIVHNSSNIITDAYRPLEIINGSRTYGLPADIWSLGCTVYYMVTGKDLIKVPYYTDVEKANKTLKKTVETMFEKKPDTFYKLLGDNILRGEKRDILCGFSLADVHKFLMLMLQTKPEKRKTINDLLIHEWFQKHKDSEDIKKVIEEYPPQKFESVTLKFPTSQDALSCFSNRFVEKFNSTDDRVLRHIGKAKNRDDRYYRLYRSLFLAADLALRVFNSEHWPRLMTDHPLPEQSGKKLKLKEKVYANLICHACDYIARKYFPVSSHYIDYSFPENYCMEPDWMDFSKELIRRIIVDVLDYKIYRPNLYEISTVRERTKYKEMFTLMLKDSKKIDGLTLEEICQKQGYSLRK